MVADGWWWWFTLLVRPHSIHDITITSTRLATNDLNCQPYLDLCSVEPNVNLIKLLLQLHLSTTLSFKLNKKIIEVFAKLSSMREDRLTHSSQAGSA